MLARVPSVSFSTRTSVRARSVYAEGIRAATPLKRCRLFVTAARASDGVSTVASKKRFVKPVPPGPPFHSQTTWQIEAMRSHPQRNGRTPDGVAHTLLSVVRATGDRRRARAAHPPPGRIYAGDISQMRYRIQIE